MIRASLLPLALVPLWLSCVVVNAKAVEPVPGQNSSKADRPPRNVIVGTTVFGPYGKYPGLEERLDELCDLVDEMTALTAKRYPGRGLDLSILPESAATATSSLAHDRAGPLKGEIRDTFGAHCIERGSTLRPAGRGRRHLPQASSRGWRRQR